MVFEIQRNARSFCIAKIMTTGSLSWICSGVSFFVISAIAVERLLAIKLHLRYKALITIRRVLTVVVGLWILCTALITARFLGASYQSLVIIIISMDVVCIAITVYAYLNIYLRVRQLQKQSDASGPYWNEYQQLQTICGHRALHNGLLPRLLYPVPINVGGQNASRRNP